MILFLYGNEPYRLHERLRALRLGFVKKYDALGVSETVIEGSSLTLDELARAVHSGGLFTKKRLVILRDPVQGIRSADVKTEIVSLLEGLHDDGIVVIAVEHAGSVKGADPLFSFLRALPHAEKFDTLSGPALLQWVRATLAKRGGRIDSQAVSELVSRVGDDLWRLSHEMDKLLAHANGREITREDATLFLEDALDENVFHLTDALSEQNRARALQLVSEQFALGLEPLALLSTLMWHWRTLVRVKRKIREGVPRGEIAKTLGVHPFVAEKAIRASSRFPVHKLHALFDELITIDRTLKSTREDPALLFNLFVVHACANEKTPAR